MKIIHSLSDGAFKAADIQDLKRQVEEYYKPTVTIDGDNVVVEIDLKKFDMDYKVADKAIEPLNEDPDEVLPTKATAEEIRDGWEDERGVVYSQDGSRLLKCRNKELTEYAVREGTKVICDNAFYMCRSLQSITLPAGLTCIGIEAFWNCDSLQNITLPEGLTNIGNGAFFGCEFLRSIILPSTLSVMGANPFEESGLKEIASHSDKFRVKDGFLYSGGRLISYFGKEVHLDKLPEGITSIGDEAFLGCESLRSITLPAGLTCKLIQAFTSSQKRR